MSESRHTTLLLFTDSPFSYISMLYPIHQLSMASRFALVIISYRTKLFHFSVLPRHPDGLAPIQRSKSNFSYPISFLLLTLECCLSAFIIVCRRGMRRKSWDLKYLKASVQPLEPLLSSSFCCVDLCTNILFHRLFCRCHLFESYAS